MPRARAATTKMRKTPKQARSLHLVESILQAAIRILEREGAAAFTTIRVAEQAGVSVGSLYQYFPSKESILFRLQQDEWAQTGALLDGILGDVRKDATVRLREAMRAFFRTEWDEAPLRRALGDAAPLYRDAPQAKAHRERGMPLLQAALKSAAPRLRPKQLAFAQELYIATMSSMGKHVSESARSPAEVDGWAQSIADMYLAWLARP